MLTYTYTSIAPMFKRRPSTHSKPSKSPKTFVMAIAATALARAARTARAVRAAPGVAPASHTLLTGQRTTHGAHWSRWSLAVAAARGATRRARSSVQRWASARSSVHVLSDAWRGWEVGKGNGILYIGRLRWYGEDLGVINLSW